MTTRDWGVPRVPSGKDLGALFTLRRRRLPSGAGAPRRVDTSRSAMTMARVLVRVAREQKEVAVCLAL